ncbi:hypothetical protein GWK47_037375 [Chionoecetes opilio]|uniref:Uncharacterized protein n=1 Tax=Chionoecetes opilio TaxID=41210 RepID=A0A8J4YPN3_CHIOP|nr:hypothetical protein GWK47_037375 [Chionoecetes opilio]
MFRHWAVRSTVEDRRQGRRSAEGAVRAIQGQKGPVSKPPWRPNLSAARLPETRQEPWKRLRSESDPLGGRLWTLAAPERKARDAKAPTRKAHLLDDEDSWGPSQGVSNPWTCPPDENKPPANSSGPPPGRPLAETRSGGRSRQIQSDGWGD